MGVCRRAALLLICFSVLNGTGQVPRDLRSNIGAAFNIRPYAQMTLEDDALSEGTTPVISQQSINEVIDVAQGQVKAYKPIMRSIMDMPKANSFTSCRVSMTMRLATWAR